MGGGGGPSEDPSAARLRARQFEDLAQLDEEQNTRIKRLMRASTGVRAFTGAPAMRIARGDTLGGRAASNYGLTRSTEPTRVRGSGPSRYASASNRRAWYAINAQSDPG